MVKNVKISPSYTLVNDKYFLNDLRESGIKNVNKFITKFKIVEKYTDEELLNIYVIAETGKYEKAIQSYLDKKAKEKGYDNILSAVTYGLVRGRFQQEGIKFAEWRTDVWDYCYTELDKITNGQRSKPTVEEFLNELPNLPLSLQ